MAYLLDTNVCIDLLRGRISRHSKARGLSLRQSVISSITVAELETGVAKSDQPLEQREKLNEFCRQLTVIAFDAQAARHYGEVRARLESRGTPIGPLDQMIAAHARSVNAVVITANVNEFRRVPGLQCLRW